MIPGLLKIEFLQAARIEEALSVIYLGMPERNNILRNSLKASFNKGEIDGITINACLTAAIDDRLVGSVTCGAYAGQNYYHLIANLVVHPDHRKKGIATRLMDEAESFIRLSIPADQRGVITLGDLIEFKNPSSQFYARRGYETLYPDEDTGVYVKSKPLGHRPV